MIFAISILAATAMIYGSCRLWRNRNRILELRSTLEIWFWPQSPFYCFVAVSKIVQSSLKVLGALELKNVDPEKDHRSP